MHPSENANNARFIEPDRVASSFVMPPFFRKLFDVRHHLLVGPRGSGKTTLLKMLRIPAIEAWGGADGDWARRVLPFVGIYIPSDVGSKGQLESHISRLPADVAENYTRARVSLLLLRAIVDAFAEKCRAGRVSGTESAVSSAVASVPIDTHTEVALCSRLIAAWPVEDAAPTFRGLRSGISGAQMRLAKTLIDDVTRNTFRRVDDLSRDIVRPVFETATHAIDVFEEVVERGDYKWALLFDELEITPNWFQEDALRRFRSTDQRLLLKLAITPCSAAASHVGGLTQPQRTDDYVEVPLWYSDARDATRFCDAFWKKLLESRGIVDGPSPRTVLGESLSEDYEPPVGRVSGRYGQSGAWFRRIESLARKDHSFAAYLARRGVKLDKAAEIPPEKMDSVIRKVAPIAFYREYFLGDAGGGASEPIRRRSRKVVSLYSGAKNVFRVTEGNPRWFLSLVGQLLDTWLAQGRTISREQQADAIRASSERFLATVAAYPNPDLHVGAESLYPKLTVLRLIDSVGQFAFQEIVGKRFRDDPRLSVNVDLDDRLVESLLISAINYGALVLITRGGESNFIRSASGHHFRLSYHLAPRFKIPLRAGRAVSLHSVIGRRGDSPVTTDSDQLEIFPAE